MQEITFSLPCYYTVKRKRTKTVKYKTKKGVEKTKEIKDTVHLAGMNWFRNANPFVKDKAKQYYHKLVSEALQDSGIKITGKYSTEYKYCYKSDSSDAGNVISLIEKFMLDGLKECGAVIDDSVKYHTKSNGWTVEKDKDNPRVEITIKEIL